MGAPTETYIDPSIAGDSGAGTVGDPYGDVQYALDQVTRDSTNGDRFNIKAGTDEILAAALDFSTYGTPTLAAPWICQGYTSAAGDGGIGGIDGNASVASIFASTALDNIALIDMHFHNTTSSVISLDNNIVVVNCEVNNNNTNHGIDFDNYGLVYRCYIHDIASNGVNGGNGSRIMVSVFRNDGAETLGNAVTIGQGGIARGNIITIDSTSNGIYMGTDNAVAEYNAIYSSSGTGNGIEIASGGEYCIVHSNIVEGFSGVGGDAIVLNGDVVALYGHNAWYNCATGVTDNSGLILEDLTANDVALSVSAFIDAANDDFRVKPSVQALGYPTANFPNLSVRGYYDIGALQRKSQMIVHPGMSGGARG